MLKGIKEVLNSERGAYGGIELLFILAVVGVVAMLVMNRLKAGASEAADGVTTKLEDAVNQIQVPTLQQ